VREAERKAVRRELDEEMRPFRRAGMERNPTNELLRTVRQVLAMPLDEIAGKMGVSRSVLLGLEVSERRKTISMRSLARMARAMSCKVVYGVVPEGGLTLEELAEERQLALEKAKKASQRKGGAGGASGVSGASQEAGQQVGELASASQTFAGSRVGANAEGAGLAELAEMLGKQERG